MPGERQIQVFAAGQGEKVDDRGLLARQPGRIMIELSTGKGHGGQPAATGVHTSHNKYDLMNLLTFLAMARTAPPTERVTVTMPGELVAGIDRIEGNRSRFITEAVRHELQRRQRQELLRSLEAPHTDSAATAALGLADWAETLPEGDNDLLDPTAGVAVHWRQDSGWQETNAPETRP